MTIETADAPVVTRPSQLTSTGKSLILGYLGDISLKGKARSTVVEDAAMIKQ